MGSAPEHAARVRAAALELPADARRHLVHRWVDRALRNHLIEAFMLAGWVQEAIMLLAVADIVDRRSLLAARAKLSSLVPPDVQRNEPDSPEMVALTSLCSVAANFDAVAAREDDAAVFEASFCAIMAARFVERGAEEFQTQLAEASAARVPPHPT
jgi:hypothetical protein